MSKEKNFFNIVILIARPAAGKSEIIDYLKGTPTEERIERFHIADFEEIDDFPMLWTWFEEDALLQKMGQERLHSDENQYFKGIHLWDLLIERICLEYNKKLRDTNDLHRHKTVLIEFARGSQHGGFQRAFKHLSEEILKQAVIVYINVSYQESLRKNAARFNPERPDSILEHGLSNEKMEVLYKDSDWDEIEKIEGRFIDIQGVQVPYVVFENEDDVTTGRGAALGERLQEVLNKLWQIIN